MTKIVFSTPALSASSTPGMPDFSRVCKELHDNLIAAGMVATSDTGQLDFANLATLPLIGPSSYGYRMYKLDDGIALPVYLKLRFMSGPSINSNNRQPWALGISIGIATNGAGVFTQGTAEYFIGCVDGYQNTDPSNNGLPIPSLICCKAGFLGVSWKQRITRGNVSYAPSDADSIGIGNFFICRDTNDSGENTAAGVSLIVIAPGGTSYNTFGGAPLVAHMSSVGEVIVSRRTCYFIGSDTLNTVDGKIPLFNMYTLTPAPRRIAQLLIAGKPVGSTNNDEFDSKSVGTAVRRFIAMNSCWPGDIFNSTSARAAIAMLWED